MKTTLKTIFAISTALFIANCERKSSITPIEHKSASRDTIIIYPTDSIVSPWDTMIVVPADTLYSPIDSAFVIPHDSI